MNASDFRDIVSGRRRGLGAAALRGMLAALEVPYSTAVRWRNRRYDRGRRVERIDVPVVSVGNLTLGGTGKTPMVEWLARWFRERGVQVALVSRGYGAQAGQANDEALELAQKLPGVPHLQDPDRVRAARQAITEHGAQLILLDDGFQHRRLARDLDLVLVDALEPFGFGHVFPRGTLREPLSGWSRAHAIALTRADMIAPTERAAIRREVERYAPQAAWLEVTHAPQCLRSYSGVEQPLASLASRRVAAFCGIGNPPGFAHALRLCGYEVAGLREFPDHHRYGPTDLASLAVWAAPLNVEAIVCTHKDLVKIPQESLGELPLFALSVGLEFLSGREELEALLQLVMNARKT